MVYQRHHIRETVSPELRGAGDDIPEGVYREADLVGTRVRGARGGGELFLIKIRGKKDEIRLLRKRLHNQGT